MLINRERLMCREILYTSMVSSFDPLIITRGLRGKMGVHHRDNDLLYTYI